MDEPAPEEPAEEAYNRVTNPGRFAALHDVALAEIDRLVATYEVERTDGVALPAHERDVRAGDRVIGLVPAGGGAPLTVVLTPFPGVKVAAGHSYQAAFPRCGCDACDEQPAPLMQEVLDTVGDLVAGRLVETRRRRLLRSDLRTVRLIQADGSYVEAGPGTYDGARDGELPIGTTRWPAWTRRGARPRQGSGDDPDAMEAILVFGRSGGDRVEIGPFRAEDGQRFNGVLVSIEAEAVMWQAGQLTGRRRSVNGFEARAIQNLRTDLRLLRDLGRGQIYFGDHDCYGLVELHATGAGAFALEVTLPDIDRWMEPLGTIGTVEIDRLIAAVDRIEEHLGDLSGYPNCCGRPDPTFSVTEPDENST